MEDLTMAINCMELTALTGEIRRTMRRSAKDAVQLGYMLRRVMEEKLWDGSYSDFDEYLQTELQMDYTLANRLIGINKRFSLWGKSMEIAEKYERYSQGLLIEMLNMTPEQEEKVTPGMTVKQAREIKKQDRAPKQEPVLSAPEKHEVIIDGEFRELKESEKVATSQPEEPVSPYGCTKSEYPSDTKICGQKDFRQEKEDSENDLFRLKRLLDRKKQELEECVKVDAAEGLPEEYLYEKKIIVGALANMLCELEDLQDSEPELTQEQHPQSDLPVLKNNEQRQQWLKDYRSWGLWYRDENIDVNYYKYDFTDGSRLIVAEYPQRRCSWRNEKEDQAHYHLLEKNCKGYKGTYDKQFVHSTDSATYLVEFLKSLQKGERG